MGGGLLQLVAYGAQDVYLTGNPQITFFKVVYRRHTNFAMEAIQQTFSGIPDFGNTVYCQISRNGDLINRAYLEVTLPAMTASNMFVNYIGLRLLKSVTIEIGGQQIDKHYSDWLYIWNELSLPIGKRYAWEQMVGADQDITSDTTSTGVTLFVPLEFWFCRTIGLALPLIALQYHEVKLKIEFESHNNCIYQMGTAGTANDTIDPSTTYKLQKANLWVDYIFLDTDERRKFAQLSHEYLIEQLQFTGSESLTTGTSGTSTRVKLNFNHPCKELVWVAKYASSTTRNHWYNYTVKADGSFLTGLQKPSAILAATTLADLGSNILASSNAGGIAENNSFITKLVYNVEPGFSANSTNPFERCLLQLNGNDRFAQRDGSYFNYVQPFQHHTNIPANQGINVYSFALKPEEHQPSGTLNMSRIDTAVLAVDAKKSTGTLSGVINIYATNYNVLRILSGMGGLAYSN
jgi:hypothetical protein